MSPTDTIKEGEKSSEFIEVYYMGIVVKNPKREVIFKAVFKQRIVYKRKRFKIRFEERRADELRYRVILDKILNKRN